MSGIVFPYYPRSIFLYFHISIVDAELNWGAVFTFAIARVCPFFLTIEVLWGLGGVDRARRKLPRTKKPRKEMIVKVLKTMNAEIGNF